MARGIYEEKKRNIFLSYVVKKVLVLFCTMSALTAIYANPTGGEVAAGSATITQSGTHTEITQTTDKAIVNWQSFNIGANESTHFQLPSSESVTLNRINPGQGASQIFGSLTSNGRIILVNQAGIYFSASAHVDVGGIMASTVDITDQNFLAGKYVFDQPSSLHGTVVNRGTIIAANNGLVALIGSNVSNEGYIQAHAGSVVLASGEKFTVDLNGDGLVHFTVDQAASGVGVDPENHPMQDGVKNSGTIIADGGKIVLTAKTASGVVDNAINMSGVVQAHSVSQKNGEIIFSAEGPGVVRVAGTIDASGKTANHTGGKVKILGAHIQLKSPTVIDVSGINGGGEVLIGGNYRGLGPEQNALTTVIDSGVMINANALLYGNGGRVIAWSDGYTGFHGNISAQGGIFGGNGGFVETSGHYLTISGGRVNLLAPNGYTGDWLLDPTDLTISASASSNLSSGSNPFVGDNNSTSSNLDVADLVAALGGANVTVQTTAGGTGLGSGDITVATGITWSAATKLTLNAYRNIIINAPISGVNGSLELSATNAAQSITTGALGTVNVANFNLLQGQWYQVGTLPSFTVTNNFQIASGAIDPSNVEFLRASSSGPYVIEDIYGLQGIYSSAALRSASYQLGQNIDASVTANWNSGEGFRPIGIGTATFAGSFNGNGKTINNLYMSLGTTILNGDAGLFGNLSGSVSNVGLTNINYLITATNYSYNHNLGGLVGTMQDSSSVANSYVTGTITATDNCSGGCLTIGGLVGIILTNSSVSNSFSNVDITMAMNTNGGGSIAGGFAGANWSSANPGISNSYNLGSVSVTASGAGGHFAGGFVGYNVTGSYITNSFNMGRVSTTNTTVGGFAGINNATITNSFLDTATSGQTSRVGSGSTSGVTSGTFDGSSGSNLSSQTTFTNAGWTFDASNWGILSAQSYPYLRSIYTSTPSAVSGIAVGSGTAGNTMTLAVNGSALANTGLVRGTTKVGANGFYYFLEANGAISNGNTILTYLSGASTKGNAIALAGAGGNLSNLNISAANNINIGTTTDANAYSNSSLITALGGLSSTDILFSNPSGNIINLGNATNTTANLNVGSSGVVYTLNGGIGSGAGATSTSLSFAGATTINNSGSAITTLGNQTYTGTQTLSSNASLTGVGISLAAITGSGNGLTINTSGSSTISGLFSGTGSSLTKEGAGTLTLSAANTYTGTTSVNAGTLRQGIANATGSTSNLIMADVTGALFDLNGYGAQVLGLSGGGSNGGNISMGSSTLSVGNSGTTYSGALSGNSSSLLWVTGITIDNSGVWHYAAGAQTFAGTSTNTGQVYAINLGSSLGISNASAVGTGAIVIYNANTLTLNNVNINNTIIFPNGGGTVVNATGTSSIASNLFLPSGGDITFGGTGTLTLNGAVSAAYGFAKSGSGTLVLAGNNTFTGATAVNAGTLSLAHANAVASSSSVTMADGTTLNINNVNPTIGTLNLGSNVTMTGAGSATLNKSFSIPTNLTLGGAGTLTLSGTLSGSNGLTKNDAGTVVLSGSNTYTGSTTVNTGTLSLAHANAVASSSDVTLADGTTLDINNVSMTIGTLNFGSTLTLTGTGTATLANNIALPTSMTLDGTGTLTLSGVLSGGNGFTKSGSGTVVLSNTNTFTGAATVNAGALSIGNANALANTSGVIVNSGGSFDINNTSLGFSAITFNSGSSVTGTGTATFTNDIVLPTSFGVGGSGSLTLSGVLSGANGLTKSGAGTVTLSNTNTYTGNTTINAGTLSISADANLGAAPGSPTVGSISFGGGTLKTTSNFTLNSNRGIALNSGGGTISTDPATTLTYNGIIAGANTLTKAGTGTLVLGGTNTHSAGTAISAGILQANSNNALGTNTVTVSSGGELLLNGVSLTTALNLNGTGVSSAGALATMGSTSNTVNAAITLAGATTISVTNAGDTLTLGSSGTINGAYGLTFAGAGGLTLNGVVGGSSAPTSLATSSSGTTTIGANITTAGSQTYNNSTSSSTGITLTATGGSSDITIGTNGYTMSGANTLALSVGRNIILNGPVSATSGTLSLTAANSAQSITTGASGTIDVANFNLLQGQWYQVGTLPSFAVTNNFRIASGSAYPVASARFNASFLRAAGGAGTSGSPYQIADIFGLQGIATQALTNSYIQTANINAATTLNWSGSLANISGFVPIGSGEYNSTTGFSGSYNGGGYTISNMYINANTNDIGIFGSLNGVSSVARASISNLIVTGLNVTGVHSTGGLAGNTVNADFTNILVSGTVTATGSNIGMLTGWYDTGTISNVGVSGSVTTAAGQTGQGGLFGNGGGTISNVYSTVNVTGGNGTYSGGLIGRLALGTLASAYSTGAVVPSSGTGGGLIGIWAGGSVSNSYWDSQTSGRSTSAAGTTRTTAQLQQSLQTGFAGGTWGLIAGNGSANGSYPYLLSLYSSTPRVISGYAPGGSAAATGLGGATVKLAYNGSNIDTTYTGANGFYYFLEANGVIADSSSFLTYLNSGATKANVVGLAHASGASAVLLNMTANATNIYGNNSSATTNTLLGTAKGSLSSTDILYSLSGANLSLGNSTNTTSNLLTLNSTKNAAGTVTSNIATNYTIDGSIDSGSGATATSLNFSGATTINNSGNSITTLGNQIYSNTLTLSSNASLTGVDLSLAAITGGGNGLTMSTTGNSSMSGAFSGTSSSLTKSGAGTLTLSAANTFTGATAINGGTLTLSHASAISSSSGLTMGDSTTLNINGVSPTINSLSLGSGVTITGTGTSTLANNITLPASLTLGGTGTLTLSGVLTGGNGFTKSGAGTVILSNANTFTGAVAINAGSLSVSNTNALSGVSGVTIGSSSVFDVNNISLGFSAITFNSGSSLTGTGTATFTNDIVIPTSFSVGGAGSLTLSGILSGSNGLTKTGAGTVTLSNTNTYTGNTTINAGTLSISADANLGAAPSSPTAGSIAFGGGTLKTTANFTLNSNRGVALNSGGGTISTDPSTTLTYNGIIAGANALTKAGSGALVLGGSNTYTGSTSLSAGTLTLGSSNGLGSTSSLSLSNVAGAGLDMNGYNLTLNAVSGGGASGGNIALNSGTLTIGDATSTTYSGIISGNGNLDKQGSGTLTLAGSNTFLGSTTLSAGTLSVSSDAAFGSVPSSPISNSIIFNGGTLQNTGTFTLNVNRGILLSNNGLFSTNSGTVLTIDGIISGTSGIIQSNTGTLTLNGSNSYSGSTSVTGGTLALSSAGALGNTSSVGVNSGATLSLANASAVTGKAVNLNSGSIFDINNLTAFDISSISLGSGTTLSATGTSSITQSFVLPSSFSIGGSGNLTLSGVLSGSYGFTKIGSGVVILSGANTYTGLTTINTGILRQGAANVLTTTSGITLANTSGAAFDLNGYASAINSLSGGGASGGNVTLGSAALTVGDSNSTTYSGSISGAGSVIKQGSGVLTLAGANTYTGSTTVNQGTLSLSNLSALGSSSALILSNGTTWNINNISPIIPATLTIGSNVTISSSGASAITKSISLPANLTFDVAGTLNITNPLTGSNGFTKTGSGILTMSGIGTHSGTVTVNQGTLKMGVYNAFSAAADLVLADVAGVTFDLNNKGATVLSLSGGGTSGGNITNLNNGTTLSIGSYDTTFSGNISGDLGTIWVTGTTIDNSGVYHTGTGRVNFAGTSSGGYAGQVYTANQGKIGISSVGAVGAGLIIGDNFQINNVTLNNNFSLYGGTIYATGNAGISGTMSLQGGFTMNTANVSDTLNLSGVISSPSTYALNKTGLGTLTLSGANTYTGATNVSAGTLKLGVANAINTSSGLVFADVSGAAFDFNGYAATIKSIAGGGSNGGNIILGSQNLVVGDTTSSTYSGVISGSGNVTKQGSGTLTLAGANAYTGSTAVSAGTLSLSNANLFSSTSGTTVNSSATLDLNNLNLTTLPVTFNSGSTLSATGTSSLSANLVLPSSFSIGGNGGLTLSGVLSGSNGITKIGTGSVTLAGASTYSGATIVNAGTLIASNASSFGSTSGITTNSGGILSLALDTALQGKTGTINSGGTLDLNNVTLSALPLSLSSGAILTATGNSSITSDMSLPNSVTLSGSGVLTLSGVLSGASTGITKTGSGTAILSGANTYTGSTTINTGILSINSDAALGAVPGSPVASSITFGGGTLETSATFTLNANRGITLGSGGGTILTDPSTALTYNGIISGANTLTKSGSGTFIVGAANTNSGSTVISAGTLQQSANNALSSASDITLANTSGAVLDLNGYNATTGSITGGGVSGGNITLGSGSLTLGGATTTTYSGIISGSGNVLKQGSGQVTLAGANSYTGSTTINNGILSLSNTNNTSGITVNSGGTLDFNNISPTIPSLTFNSSSTLTASAGTVILANDISLPSSFNINSTGTGTLTLNGVLSGANGFTKAGFGSVVLAGTNTYSGVTIINAGTVTASNANALGNTSSVTVNSGAILSVANATAMSGKTGNVNSGGTIDINNIDIGSTLQLTLNSGSSLTGTGVATLANNIALPTSFTLGGTGTLTVSGVLSGANGFTKSGSGKVILSGSNTYSGTTRIGEGTLSITNANALGSTVGNTIVFSGAALELNNVTIGNEALSIAGSGVGLTGALSGIGTSSHTGNITLTGTSSIGSTGDLTLSGVISGSFGITKRGVGNVTLAGANTYTLSTAIQQGMLSITNASGLGGTGSGTSILNGSTLNINNVNVGNETITLLGSLIGTGNASLSGNVALSSSGTRDIGGTGTLTLSGIISGATRPLTKNGTGTVILNGVNTYTGTTTINAGTLRIAADSGLGAAPGSVTPGSIVLNGGTLDTANTFTLNSNRGIALSANSGISTMPGTTLTYNGIIAGTGGLTKSNTGNLILGGMNTYTGTTTINGGTLRQGVANTINSSSGVTLADTAGAVFDLNNMVASIGTLAGGGNNGGNVLLGAATLTVGNSNSATFAGSIIGGGGLIKQGNGALTLAGTNTYSGATLVNGGTLSVANANALANTVNVNMASGTTLDINNVSISQLPLTLNPGVSLTGTGVAALGNNIVLPSNFVVGGVGTLILTGRLSGDNGVTKSGVGNVILAGENTYSGMTLVNAGTLTAASPTAFGLPSNGTVVAPGAVVFMSNVNLAPESLLLNGNATLLVNSNSPMTYNGNISGTGNLLKIGGGVLTLGGVNTYRGQTIIAEGGILQPSQNTTTTSNISNVININNYPTVIKTVIGGMTPVTNAQMNSLAVGREVASGYNVIINKLSVDYLRGIGMLTIAGQNINGVPNVATNAALYANTYSFNFIHSIYRQFITSNINAIMKPVVYSLDFLQTIRLNNQKNTIYFNSELGKTNKSQQWFQDNNLIPSTDIFENSLFNSERDKFKHTFDMTLRGGN